MFTGIIETVGKVKDIKADGTNVHFTISSTISSELKIDQSVCHDGVCLTVVETFPDSFKVTAIQETLDKTNLRTWQRGSNVNLERAMKLGDRLDGHIVQGHVDTTAKCVVIDAKDGSHIFGFEYEHPEFSTVEKGSITVNGVSLTVVESKKNYFSVAIIPYTYLHTTFEFLEIGSVVNLEFDVIGKYIKKLMNPYL